MPQMLCQLLQTGNCSACYCAYRADKYTCPQLDRLARDFLRCNFEKVVQFDGQPPNRVGLTSLSHAALVDILADDNLELSSEVKLELLTPDSALCAEDNPSTS